MKRILVVSQHFWPEPFRINDIVEGFVQQDIQVDVLCGLPNYPKGEWFEGYRYTTPRRQQYKGAQVFRAGEIPRRGNTGPMIFLNYISWPVFALFHLWRLKGPYDAVLCYNTSPVLMNLPAILYAKLHRVPLVSYVLDIWPENLYSVLPVSNPLLCRIALWVSDWHYKQADRLIAMSDSLKERLMERTGFDSSRVWVIPQHCEDFYAQPGHDPALEQRFAGGFNLLFAGNFSPAQSLDTVIRAVVQAKQQGAQDLRLILVGDGMSRPQLEQLAAQLNAQDTVVFAGSTAPQNIPCYTSLAQALVAPLSASRDLGMTVPAKIAGDMAAAKPILASMDGEGARAVEQAQCGYTSPAQDANALAQRILQLYNTSPQQRAAMGQRAFAYYQAHYQRSSVLEQLVQALSGPAPINDTVR